MRTFKALNPLSLIAVFLLALPLGYAQSALGQDVDSVTFDSRSQTLTYYPSQSAASCRADCQNNPLCAAYSWVKPGGYTVGDPPVCYLIATVGPLVQSPCCISAVKGGTPPVAGSQTFSDPTSQGYRVDRCLYWAQQCDEPAATAWCSTQGYARATNWQWVYVKPTLVLGDGSVCDTDDCGGFSSITCSDGGQLPPPLPAGTWVLLPGAAMDIGIGANGDVWVTGTDSRIYKWDGSTWVAIDGAAVRVAVDPTGAPWVVNAGGGIYRRTGDAWIQLPGAAMDIGIGANGDVWVTGTDSRIYKWDGSSWVAIDGVAVRIAVDSGGNPWVVNAGGGIYRRTGDAWIQLPGAAMDIGIGANGDVWVTGTDSRIYKWDGSTWVAIDGAAVQVAVDPTGAPWVVNASGQIYRQMR